jgi:hypothetical protein
LVIVPPGSADFAKSVSHPIWRTKKRRRTTRRRCSSNPYFSG